MTRIADLADRVAHEHDGQAAAIPASVAEHVIFSGQARRNIRENLPLEVLLAAMETIDRSFDPPGPRRLPDLTSATPTRAPVSL